MDRKQRRNKKTNVKKGCQQKQSAGDKLPSDEKKIVEQEENYCKISKLRILKRWGEKWIWVSGYGKWTETLEKAKI